MSSAVLIQGLGWGDESKGCAVDKLCRELPVDLIVRFNGASQAAHNVITPEGIHHTFSQFGSGMLANNKVRTHLSRFMLVNPLNMMNEAEELAKKTADPWNRVTVDPECVIITPFHRRLNRLRETTRGDARHGSCGQGVGVARELHLKHGDEVILAKDLKRGREFIIHMLQNTVAFMDDELVSLGEEMRYPEVRAEIIRLADQYEEWPLRLSELPTFECAVFEGAQGVLLDEKHGQAPHNTWTNTTFENADTLLDEVGVKDRTRIGCLRTYHTRHGAGPFPTENNSLDLPEPHNGTGEFQGAFRVGAFDFLKTKQAIDIVGGIDYLSLSHIDYLERMGLKKDFAEDIAGILEVPLGMRANGPTADHRKIEMGVKV